MAKPNKLYGRQREMQILLEAFARSREGGKVRLVLTTAPAPVANAAFQTAWSSVAHNLLQ